MGQNTHYITASSSSEKNYNSFQNVFVAKNLEEKSQNTFIAEKKFHTRSLLKNWMSKTELSLNLLFNLYFNKDEKVANLQKVVNLSLWEAFEVISVMGQKAGNYVLQGIWI